MIILNKMLRTNNRRAMETSVKSTPPSNKQYKPYDFLSFSTTISVWNLTLGSACLVCFSFLFCVVWSLAFNFKTSTHTSCNVLNVLPSFSSAIGRNRLQGYVWKTAVALNAVPHLLHTRLYHKYNKDVLLPQVHFFVNVLSALTLVENIALIGLSFVTSEMHYSVHQNFFLVFMVSSEVYMFLTCWFHKLRRQKSPNNLEVRSLYTKCVTFAVNVVSFIFASYFFIRHAVYCEPLVFSLFSFFEYIVVLANIAFHLTACWDFSSTHLAIHISGISISTTVTQLE